MRNQKGFTLFELLFVVWGLVCLAIGGGILYAIFHFVAKFWQHQRAFIGIIFSLNSLGIIMKNRKHIISRAFQAAKRDEWLLQKLVARVLA